MDELTISVDGRPVGGLLARPAAPVACYVMAHGAGAGMRHAFLTAMAEGLLARNVATLRYQFPYMEERRSRPDGPAVAMAAVAAAIAAARDALPGVPLHAGGKSFGGRMTSELASRGSAGVASLIFLGFPLHAPNRPSRVRAEPLGRIQEPMLFLQGTRDDLADLALMREVTTELGARATLHVVEGADHSFHVLKRSGRTDALVLHELLETMCDWIQRHP
jgi:predicted alpha/beta-hydrolase family hydrolase